MDLAVTALVNNAVDLSHNQISKITNNDNVDLRAYSNSFGTSIDLTNNSAVIDVNDVVYEMYGSCFEVQQVFNSSAAQRSPLLTLGFININFNTSRINCSCNQYYLQQCFLSTFGSTLPSSYALSNALCTDGTPFYNSSRTSTCQTSSAAFGSVAPRLCAINQSGSNIVFVNDTDNATAVSSEAQNDLISIDLLCTGLSTLSHAK